MEDISFKIYKDRVKVVNSYQVTDRYRIKEILFDFHLEHLDIKFNRSVKLLIKEWVTHNRLYKLGIKRDRTKDVDLEYNQKWYLKIIYSILGV